MDLLITLLFVANVILAITDAAVAYQMAPRLVAAIISDPDVQPGRVKKLRSLLPLLVALYVTLDCQAHALRHPGYLGGLTLLLMGDIVVQLLVARKQSGVADGGGD